MENSLNKEIEFLGKKILRLNGKLIESEGAKSRFLSLVASELNNPMTALLGLVPHLQIVQNEKNAQIFEIVNKELLNLQFKIENLVMASQIEGASMEKSYSKFNVVDVLDEVLESLKYIIEERKINIAVSQSAPKQMVGDVKVVGLILKNLLSNACQYAKENTNVAIDLEKTGT